MEIYFNNDKKLVLSGRISIGDFANLEKVLENFPIEEKLNILLSSKGGNLSAVILPAHKIEKYEPIIYVTESVDSAALLLLVVGKKRYAQKDATFLFHLPKNIETGKVDMNMAILNSDILSKYLNISKKEILDMIIKNKKLNVDEAIKIGLIHEIY